MSVYTAKNVECLFYRLKSQGKVKMKDIPGVNLILKTINDLNYNIGILNRRRKRFKARIAECQAETERYGILCNFLREIEERLLYVRTQRDDAKRERDRYIADYLEGTFDSIVRNRISIAPYVEKLELGKYMVSVETLEEKLVCQLIKEDLKRAYKVVPADRNEIVAQLKCLLKSNLPKVIIRADVRRFFESVSLEDIIDKIARNAYLNKLSLKYLKRFYHYLSKDTDFGITSLENEDACSLIAPKIERICGLPRGLAFSSYLAEIFMQEIDKSIEAIDGVVYYRRYVDDIIIIASSDRDVAEYWSDISGCVSAGGETMRLHEDSDKKSLNVTAPDVTITFDYLGYSFKVNSAGVSVGLAQKRKEKYISRIDAIFNYYGNYPYASRAYRVNHRCLNNNLNKKRIRSVDPLRELFAMLSCLTGNGHLEGDKRNVSIGSYFSNRHITDLSDLKTLDDYLLDKINKAFNPPATMFCYGRGHDREWYVEKIRDVMKKWTFTDGFHSRRFCKNPKFTYTLGRIKSLE